MESNVLRKVIGMKDKEREVKFGVSWEKGVRTGSSECKGKMEVCMMEFLGLIV